MADRDRLWSRHLAPYQSLAAWMSPLAEMFITDSFWKRNKWSIWWILAGRRKGKRRESRQHYLSSTAGEGRWSPKVEIEGAGTHLRKGAACKWGDLRGRWGKWEAGQSCQPHCPLWGHMPPLSWVYTLGVLLFQGIWKPPATGKETQITRRAALILAVGNWGHGLLDVCSPGKNKAVSLLGAAARGESNLISVRYFPTWTVIFWSKTGFFKHSGKLRLWWHAWRCMWSTEALDDISLNILGHHSRVPTVGTLSRRQHCFCFPVFWGSVWGSISDVWAGTRYLWSLDIHPNVASPHLSCHEKHQACLSSKQQRNNWTWSCGKYCALPDGKIF